MELIDIVDQNDVYLGYQIEKKEAHQQGLFHRAAHIWIINKDKEVIIQKRSAFKDTCPNMWDISSAGHIQTKETVIEGAIRELYEELGIQKEINDFVFVGKHCYKSERNNEWCYVYVIYDDRDLSEYSFIDQEVTEIKRVYYKDLKNVSNMVAHNYEFEMLEKFIDECVLIKDSEHLYHLPYNPDTDRPNLYLIKGQDYNIAVDGGNSRNHCLKFYLAIKLMGLNIPEVTIVSHWHWDHTFGLCAVDGTIVSTRLTSSIIEKMMDYIWTKEAMEDRLKDGVEIQFCHDNILKEYPDLSEISLVNSNAIVENKAVLDLGDIEVELIAQPSTHSLDSLFVYIPSDKALIIQDSDWIDCYKSDDYDDKNRLLEMIKFFESIDYDYHYLGHVERETKEEAINRLKMELARL